MQQVHSAVAWGWASFPFHSPLLHFSKHLASRKLASINVPNHPVFALVAKADPRDLMARVSRDDLVLPHSGLQPPPPAV